MIGKSTIPWYTGILVNPDSNIAAGITDTDSLDQVCDALLPTNTARIRKCHPNNGMNTMITVLLLDELTF